MTQNPHGRLNINVYIVDLLIRHHRVKVRVFAQSHVQKNIIQEMRLLLVQIHHALYVMEQGKEFLPVIMDTHQATDIVVIIIIQAFIHTKYN